MMACAHSSNPEAVQGASAENTAAEKPTPQEPPARIPTQKDADRVPGEYLVTVQNGGDESVIRQQFAKNSVRSVQKMREDLFIISVEPDPGPEAMRQIAASCNQIRAVQPNFLYRTDRPPGNLPDQVK